MIDIFSDQTLYERVIFALTGQFYHRVAGSAAALVLRLLPYHRILAVLLLRRARARLSPLKMRYSRRCCAIAIHCASDWACTLVVGIFGHSLSELMRV